MPTIQRALISVTDKAGVADFAAGLHRLGIEIVSTGGTASAIRNAGVPVRDVSEVTGFPEMLDGRVKTIHPRIAGGVLAMRANSEHMAAIAEHGIPTVDMVVVNLYAFEAVAAREGATVEELIENIDIGGPTMIRAAAKNWQDVAVVVHPADYPAILSELQSGNRCLPASFCWVLAKKAFAVTAAYDRAITARLASLEMEMGTFVDRTSELPEVLTVAAPRAMALRYGENPHQKAGLYTTGGGGVAGARQLHGKELSYNNLVDLDAAWQLVSEFRRPAAAIIKHTNPCGCAEQATLAESYRKAFEADPVSAFGGVLAFNEAVDEETASEITKTFIEAIAAPGYSPQALALLQGRKNLRVLELSRAADELAIKSISGGFLAQTLDNPGLPDGSAVKVVTQRQPDDREWRALEFGWKVCKHVKSNAIVYARTGQSVSVGAGQMSRVDSVKVGAMKAVLPLAGTVLASDAFFPFPDGVEEAARHGITAVIQPGGSVRDEEVIAAADRLGLAMVFTGTRHFRH
ncbi:MAG TPA: bifunctional phosphoribosylaminoimidazolecarboxamide formyltransferase/IMP cyclohydrolase [Bryobacteraceae bacterium]|nr:bifunctional phosphoribosylaminoimidazolecarboxamide formyltransferase/IMP cyclohydrolase [Bryobacteraceae bacterium]